jgi:multimeric flavodoxin WrbA
MKVAIVYFSGSGHTEVLAEYVFQGVNSQRNVQATLFKVDSVTKDPTVLNDYDALIFGTPTYMGSVAAQFKAFMDATAKIWYGQQWKDKLAAGFTNSGSMSGDKFNTLVQLVTFASQHGMIWVTPAQMNESTGSELGSGHPECVNRVGSYLGVMAQSDHGSPKEYPPEGDRQTAFLLGKRVATSLVRWMRGEQK